MKKLFFITCAAALISIGSIAQVQDDADTASTNYNLQETEDRMEQDVERAGDEIENETERTGNELRRETEQAGDEIEQGAERTGDEIEQGAERTGDEIEQGAERAENEIDQGMEQTGDELENAGDEIDQNTQPADETQDQDPSNQGMGETDTEAAPTDEANRTGARDESFANPIDVIEGKEGPENQVVYKYRGELFYIDREEGKLVKTEESELKDVNQNKIIQDDQETEDQ